MSRRQGSTPEVERFAVDGFHGEVASHLAPADPAAAVAHLVDPGAALETLHWGRNYLYVTQYETGSPTRSDARSDARSETGATGGFPVVVKQFRNEGARRRVERRLRGSKAERSWRVARFLTEAGFDTPEPVMVIESEAPEGPSFYVCRHFEGATEARYLLRAANAGEAAERFPAFPMDEILDRLAHLVRDLHGHGVWFRDLTSGNVLLRREEDGTLRMALVDLNRARLGQRMTFVKRSRDLSRMPILRPEHQERYLRAYWAGDGDPDGARPSFWPAKRGLYLLFHHAFLAKNRWKKGIRGVGKSIAGRVVGRGTHAHIPRAPEDASSRERVVWDHLSDQPHLHATPLQKLATRLGDARSHLEEMATVARVAPRVLRRYRALRRQLYDRPVSLLGPEHAAGVALRPWPEDPEGLLELVDGLAPPGSEARPPILLRLHPWEPDGLDAEEELARALVDRGHEVAFAVPQTRDLVRQPASWRAALDRIAERLTPYGRTFQVGQAINRSKWGVWTLDEYVELVRSATDALRGAREDVEILGPAVIDFEYHAAAAALNIVRSGDYRFDAVSALLYVDRRGAPEAKQTGFDTVDKVVLLRAIAETARNATPRCWITEVNWPLWEGPHSPAGQSVSVSEETQADYLVRYYLLTLCTGLVERVYWWQMIARGYGLVCPENGDLRRRPAYRALATMLRELQGATFLGPVPAEANSPARLYRFSRPDGTETIVAWSADNTETTATLPRPARRVVTRDGVEEEAPGEGLAAPISSSPRYFVFES